jgi:acetyl esterase/lipase
MRFLPPVGFCLVILSTVAVHAEIRRDIEYGQAGNERLLLDVNIPDSPGPHPVAILIHGGGWGSGDKAGAEKPGSGADITPWFAPLTGAGYTWFSINYRLAPANRWPACYEDVQTAIRWVKAHAAEFKGDPSRIAVFGHSAGGHLALLAAIQARGEDRVQAAVGYAPVTEFEQELPVRKGISLALQNLHNISPEITPEALKILRETSPINHITTGAGHPPVLILHGEVDKTVPLQQSINFQERMRAHGFVCDMIILPGAAHRLTEWDKFDPEHAKKMLIWLEKTLATKPAP